MTAFDTNVLIYTCDHSDPHRQRRAFEVIEESSDGVLLWQVAIEFVAASRKLASQGFAPADAWARLREFMDVLHLVLPSPRVLNYAQPLHQHKGVSFWDAMVIGACIDSGVERLYSEDLPGGAIEAGLEIINPFR